FFFFQAEDGIRDATVTGVQTCALPIYFVQFELKRSCGSHSGLSRYLPISGHGNHVVVRSFEGLEDLGREGPQSRNYHGETQMSYVRSLIASIRVGWSRDFGWTNPILGFSLKLVDPIASTMTALTILYIGFKNGASIASAQFPFQ